MSLFKRPAWAKQQLSDDDDGGRSEGNIFSHSHSYRDIVEEQERRKKEKAGRKKAKAERRASDKREVKHEVKHEPSGESTAKRRRITSEEGEKLLRGTGLAQTVEQSDDEEIAYETTPVRRSPRKQKQGESASGAVRSSRQAAVIDLGGSSDEGGENADDRQAEGGAATQPDASASVEEIRDDSEDDEFAELARKARQERLQNNNRSSHTPNPNGPSPSPGVGPSHHSNHDRPPDPTIQLLVTSSLPGTNPLIVHRKLSQPIGAIRQAWCQKQNFSSEFTATVFFTHRMRRVYDVTTCRSLGLEVDEYGNVVMKGAEGKEGLEKVHLEAVTEEVFRQMKEREEKVRNGEIPVGEGDEQAGTPAAETQQKEESLIRLVLKAKGMKDFKLKVKPVSLLPALCLYVPCLPLTKLNRVRPSPASPPPTPKACCRTPRDKCVSSSTARTSTRTPASRTRRSRIWTIWTCI